MAELRRYKPELTEHLCDLAWRDIERDVLGYGACLLWSEVLDDYIAFYVTDDDRAKVPPGFVPYSHVEMLLMFGPEQADWSPEGLRKIHAAKKLGANVIEARDDGHIADASP